MPNFLVTIHYSKEFPTMKDSIYLIESQPNSIAARATLREQIGYNPGAPITTEELPIRATPAVTKKVNHV